MLKFWVEALKKFAKWLFGESGLKSPIKKIEEERRPTPTLNNEETKPTLGPDEILMREYDSVVKQIIHWDSHFWHKSQFFLAIQSAFVIGALTILTRQTPILFGVTIFNIYLCYVWFRTNRRNREYINLRTKRAKDIEADKRLQDILRTFRSEKENLSSCRSAEWEVHIPIVFIVAWMALSIFAPRCDLFTIFHRLIFFLILLSLLLFHVRKLNKKVQRLDL